MLLGLSSSYPISSILKYWWNSYCYFVHRIIESKLSEHRIKLNRPTRSESRIKCRHVSFPYLFLYLTSEYITIFTNIKLKLKHTNFYRDHLLDLISGREGKSFRPGQDDKRHINWQIRIFWGMDGCGSSWFSFETKYRTLLQKRYFVFNKDCNLIDYVHFDIGNPYSLHMYPSLKIN